MTEEKKLNDYLHLYLGCDVERTTLAGKRSVRKLDIDELYRVSKESYPYTIKPLLRPLSSITDDEWQEIMDNTAMPWHLHTYNGAFDVFKELFLNEEKGDEDYHWSVINQVLITMRKRGIDVDNLIPAGLAIDQTTYHEHKN